MSGVAVSRYPNVYGEGHRFYATPTNGDGQSDDMPGTWYPQAEADARDAVIAAAMALAGEHHERRFIEMYAALDALEALAAHPGQS